MVQTEIKEHNLNPDGDSLFVLLLFVMVVAGWCSLFVYKKVVLFILYHYIIPTCCIQVGYTQMVTRDNPRVTQDITQSDPWVTRIIPR